jgi:triphosphoribosyl-dephospho-CoA synthase
MDKAQASEYVGRCASLAALLEVSAYPKPGNVHRTRDLPETRYEHFLAGGVVLDRTMGSLAERGFDAVAGAIMWEEVGLGRGILRAVKESMGWQGGGNVNLGIVLLFAPLSSAAGACLQRYGRVEVDGLRAMLDTVIKGTTSDDVAPVYEAIRTAMTRRTLGRAEELDVYDESTMDRVRGEGLNLLDIFRTCAERDIVCGEWSSRFETTFNLGFPYLMRELEKGDPNTAVVDTFLFILSRRPDTLIRRKRGMEESVKVSIKAQDVLKQGGSGSQIGSRMVRRLDEELHASKGDLNPGATADVTAACLFLALLEGWRP